MLRMILGDLTPDLFCDCLFSWFYVNVAFYWLFLVDIDRGLRSRWNETPVLIQWGKCIAMSPQGQVKKRSFRWCYKLLPGCENKERTRKGILELNKNISLDIVSWSWVFCLVRSISTKFRSYKMPQSIGWESISVLIHDFNCRTKAQFTDREYFWSHSQKYNTSLMFYFYFKTEESY